MLIQVDKVLTQLTGQPLMDQDGQGNVVHATVKMALVNAVLSPEQNEKGTDKIRKYELAKKIYNANKDVELTAEDVVLIKKRVEDVYPPLIVGQVVELLENR